MSSKKSSPIILSALLFMGVVFLPGVVRALSLNIVASDSSSDSLAVYNAETGALVLNTHIEGPFSYGMSAESFAAGDFVLIKTRDPDQCAQLTLNECRSSPYFMREIRFSIRPDSLDDNEKPLLAQPVQATAKKTSASSTDTKIKETVTIPSLVNGILNFFGINGATTTTVTQEASSMNAPTAATTTAVATLPTDATATSSPFAIHQGFAATTTEESATTVETAAQATGTPLLENAQLQEGTTTAQTSQATGFLAAVGLLSLARNNIFVAIAIIIGALLLFVLAFVLHRTNKTSKNKTAKK